VASAAVVAAVAAVAAVDAVAAVLAVAVVKHAAFYRLAAAVAAAVVGAYAVVSAVGAAVAVVTAAGAAVADVPAVLGSEPAQLLAGGRGGEGGGATPSGIWKNTTISPDFGIRQFKIFLNFRMLFSLMAQYVFRIRIHWIRTRIQI
jgi:hypothetical protein